jgi:phenylpyruvate tautomerase PptA (4-oxalocrotonate tautomerase family)
MPHLRIRALPDSAVKELSLSLPEALAKILNTSEDNFTVEKIATTFYRSGEALTEGLSDPMVEFLWFERGVDVRDAAAKKVTELVSRHTKSQFIAVVFFDLPKESYYENGVKF